MNATAGGTASRTSTPSRARAASVSSTRFANTASSTSRWCTTSRSFAPSSRNRSRRSDVASSAELAENLTLAPRKEPNGLGHQQVDEAKGQPPVADRLPHVIERHAGCLESEREPCPRKVVRPVPVLDRLQDPEFDEVADHLRRR